jgi:amphi-Trp domain-containing protein
MSKDSKKSEQQDPVEAAEAEQSEEKSEEPSRAKLAFSTPLSREEAVAYFEAIVGGLRKGSVEFRQGDEALALSPPEHLNVEVKASRKGEKSKISFEISWQGTRGAELTIVS